MYDSTPIRQIRQIYSSILALGRLPAIVEETKQTIAASAARQSEAIERLAERVAAPAAPSSSALPNADDKTHRLLAFRGRLLDAIPERMLCVDVGARWGVDNALMALKDKAKLLCFDPDAEECARLQANHSPDAVEYVALALGADGRDLQLTITKEPACSSVYPPIQRLYDQYPALNVIRPERVVSVPSTSLDSFLASRNMPKPSLFKLDTQGSELDILKGAINNLSEACMLDIEVEFNPIYQGQALFSDVDAFLRSHGFALWRLPQLVHYAPENIQAAETPVEAVSTPPARLERTNPGNGQLFWAQAHYVRASCLASDSTQIAAGFARRAAAVASAYGYWDLSLMILEKCHETTGEAALLRGILK